MSAQDFTVRLEPSGWCFKATAEVSVVEAARAAGIALPASCRNGTCRTCICHLLSGSVAYRIEWPGLSMDEKKEGLILPCVACARSDLVLSVPGAKPWESR